MAEIVVSAVVTVLIEKLLAGDLMKFARSEGIDSQLKKWKKKLLMIQDLLADAGEKEIMQRAVGRWLIELQELAYDIEDVLDDIATEVMKRKLNQQESHSHASSSSSSSTSSKLLNFIPACCINFTPHNLMYGRDISSKLDEITTRLNDLFEEKNSLGLDVNRETSTKTNKREKETSLLPNDVFKILGRDEDKEALLEKLLGSEASNNQNVQIVSIVGLGGVGKTTLARLLYNDQKVKNHFEVKAWVCVSDDFDVVNISKQIYEAVVGDDKTFTSQDLLHVALKEGLSKKRFLFVLDDVWNENQDLWEALKKPLVGAPGSKVIVTTRIKAVALTMNSVQTHDLGVLKEEVALSLFAQSALEKPNFDKHPSLKSIAKDIVEKCGCLPLALVTIGRVLKKKGNDEVEWEELLNNEIWSSQGGSDIQKALKLSYYHLPSHLKQLFAYCSLYPKDHQFDKNKLVLKWMAQGFLSQKRGGKTMESLGSECFEELLSRSFFQHVANDESRYTMHDLMNDLAISVAGEFFFLLDDKKDQNGRNEDFEKFRHFSIIDQGGVAKYRKFKELHKVRCLRTFLSLSTPSWQHFKALDSVILDLLPKLEFLRVLSLRNYQIPDEVPQCIGNLKHLRYLNFSNTDIKQIPEQVGELYNLQSLLVRDCTGLSSLPVSFAKLINLRHLDLANTPSLKKMPLGIGGLTSLQTLSEVVIEGGNGFKVSELKDLSNLQGSLSIEGLDKVVEPTEAKDANLQQKKDIDHLDMGWSDVSHELRNSTNEEVVLEMLRPPCNLKKLSISGYGGMKFPSWLGDPSFDQLTKLRLAECKNCTELATLGNLTSLQKLEVWRCRKLASIKGVGSSIMPSLKEVTLYDCDSLESYCCPNSVERLEVSCCPNLVSIKGGEKEVGSSISSIMPSLTEVTLYDCDSLESYCCPNSVERLEVSCCPNLVSIKGGEKEVGSSIMPSLKEVTLYDCDSLESYCCPNSVEKLEVSECSKLVSIKGGEKEVGSSIMPSLRKVEIYRCDSLGSYCCPNSVEHLYIDKCSSMTSLSFSKLQQEEDLPSSSSSSNLKVLEVSGCKNIKTISEEHLQSLTSLEEMMITNCPNMEYSFPSSGLLQGLQSLRELRIGELKKPMSEWGHLNYPSSLVELSLYGTNSGVVSFGAMEQEEDHVRNNTFLLPPSLTYLCILGFEEMESVSEVLQHLPLLRSLYIYNCPKLRDVPHSTSALRVNVRSW